jgi:DNA primase
VIDGRTSGSYRRRLDTSDIETIKQSHPILDVVAEYGVELRRQGRAFVARCPFHVDEGRPNFHVWSESASWWCFRCCIGGDCITFVELAENLTFREAVERLGSFAPRRLDPKRRRPLPVRRRPTCEGRAPEELRALEAATSLYHQRLLTDSLALAYLEGRGVSRELIVECRLGYAAGSELLAYLRWRSLPLGPAMRVGLLDAAGREFLAGRIVIPELRLGQPVWLVGRILEPISMDAAGEPPCPKYLGLPGTRPLLGLEHVGDSRSVVIAEGVFDYVIGRGWGYPVVGLMGTDVSASVMEQVRRFNRQYLVLDQDDAGAAATLRLVQELGSTAVPVALPEGVKDLAELGSCPDGPRLFAEALLAAAGVPPPEVSVGSP